MSPEQVATFTFLGNCVLRLMGGPSANDFANGAHAAAAEMAADFPRAHVQLDGLNGKTCRVVYAGLHPDQVFKGFEIAAEYSKESCEIKSSTSSMTRISCRPAYMIDGYDGLIQRDVDGRVIGSITVTSPAIMLMPPRPNTSASH